jgi:signal transduction histidine kinase
MSVFSSLSNRIFVATALLAGLSIGGAVYSVNVWVTAQVEQDLRAGLEEAATHVENYRSTLLEHFRREARLVADLPKLKAVVYENDPPTVLPIARDYRQQLNADLIVITGPTGKILAAIGAPAIDAGRRAQQSAIGAASEGRETVGLWPTAGGLLEVVSIPVSIGPVQPEILGTLHLGYALDDRAAARLKALTASEIVFAYRGSVEAATLAPEHWPRLAELAAAHATTAAWLGDEEYVLVSRPLVSAPGGPAGAVASAVVLRSRSERLRALSRLHAALALTGILALLAAIGLSYTVSRTVTRPLGVITRAMRAVASSGDLTRRIPEPPATRWDDEDAKLLARTFNLMTAAIARFQREASQRERLSSLGRLSTVVAHEIRNPLMIIKSALRPLRRDDFSPSQAREAAASIEEEVARLNRIVSEVLDFARPIQFELGPADVNAICREAARAVWAGEAGLAPELSLDTALPPSVTDRERLRQAIINLLTNARQAAEGAGRQARVKLVTSRRDGQVRITVSDNGSGIAADALPRVFEPFFTTKRTGSGIGLAITRNIIEGLGGTVGVARSDPQGHRHGGGTAARRRGGREGRACVTSVVPSCWLTMRRRFARRSPPRCARKATRSWPPAIPGRRSGSSASAPSTCSSWTT